MWGLHTANPEHWVPIATVSSFKRMKDFTSLGVEGIAEALRAHSEDLEVDEAGTNVRRKFDVQEPKGQFERSVYAVRLFCMFFMNGILINRAERIRRRRIRSTGKTRSAVQRIWSHECRTHAPYRQNPRIQGICVCRVCRLQIC